MEKFELKAEVRSTNEKLSSIRGEKQVPGIVYGHHQEPITLKVDASDFLRTFRKAWESHVIVLEIGKKKINVLIHDFQKEPVTWAFTHVDFYAITAWEKVHTKIHLEFVWESEAKKLWAIIEEHTKEIEVKCLSENLVDSFKVDLSLLKDFGDTIKVSDLDIDTTKFDLLTSSDDLVAHATKPAVQVIEEDVAPATEEATTEEAAPETK